MLVNIRMQKPSGTLTPQSTHWEVTAEEHLYKECGKPCSTSVPLTEQKTVRYSECTYSGKRWMLSQFLRDTIDSGKKVPLSVIDTGKLLIFPTFLRKLRTPNKETCEPKKREKAFNKDSYVKKNMKFFLDANAWEGINFGRSSVILVFVDLCELDSGRKL